MTLPKALMPVLLALLLPPWSAPYAAEYDVLELPAEPSQMASKSLIFAVRKFGDRYFAVGHRGHILFSDDGGDNWTQAQVPVRSNLLDIDFPTPELGWAVGHEGVILHSVDGGKSWVKQYDGLRYGDEGLAFYQKLAAENPDNELYPLLIEEMEFAIGQGADKPLFNVLFSSESRGHAVGAYGMALLTTDAGEHWRHEMQNWENDSFFHIFDILPLSRKGQFFMSGEAGLLMIADDYGASAKQIETAPWEGSFFTSAATTDDAIIIGGLRGRMFRTTDLGQTWTAVVKPPTSSLVDSTRLANGNLVFVAMAGEILMSTDEGVSFARLPLSTGGRIYTVAEGPKGTLLVAGPGGIHKLTLPQ